MNVNLGKRLLTALLVLVMVCVLPVTASAAETDPALENLVLDKTAKLEDDGTYTIELEAYAKGQVSVETVKRVVPADIILVLDQSGSMAQQTISGIPSDNYTVASNVTNEQLSKGTYYYKVNDNYYKVNVSQELIGSTVTYVGQDGNTYTADQLSYSWSRKYDGQVYNTATPFVTGSLKTFTRDHQSYDSYGIVNSFWYTEDTTGERSDSGMSAARARTNFSSQYDTDSTTVEFHNDGAPSAGDTDVDDLYYVAAVYIAVTEEVVNTYRYTYTYVDGSGVTRTIGTSADDAKETDEATVSPLYTRGTTSGTRLDALKYAANRFIDSIRSSAIANGVDHRVAVVGFGSDDYGNSSNEYYYSNTELFIGSTQYNYAQYGKESTHNTNGNLASNHYGEAFQNVNTADGYANLQASVNALAGKGATYPNLGFEMANGIFGANSNTTADGTTRSRIVIFLTDGEPGDSGYESDAADLAQTQAGITKNTYGATVHTVAVLDSAPTGNVNQFLLNMSSTDSYTLATSTEALDEFFQTVEETISSSTTTVTLSENSILTDRLSEYFTVPAGFSVASNVEVQVAKHTGYDAFANPTAAPTGVTAALTYATDGTTIRGISVSGFNFVSTENLVTTSVSDGGSTIATGNKLVVTITGLLAKDEAATNTYVNTNDPNSAIWDTDQSGNYGLVKPFRKPTTYVAKKLFVLDYAKETALDVYGATRVDSAADGIFSRVDENSTKLTGSYGAVSTQGGLSYDPTTTNWNGWDNFYALGKDNSFGDNVTTNIWSKVSVLPANNVYYEDDFISTTTEQETAGATAVVGIEYSGDWSVDGTSAGNTGEVDGANGSDENHGWITSKNDDTGYSDGTVHQGTAGATATFTFTGTGVDIYSKTDSTTGTVLATLTGEGAQPVRKMLIIDNLSQSGDYYQIPTLFFNDLPHGTYTVQLTVTSAAEGRSTYYLDGIRVYNPLSEEQEMTPVVEEAYKEEISATFVTIRDKLIDATTDTAAFNDGNAVFIDYNPSVGKEEQSAVLGTYVDYGPKDEVYLASGQAIYFKVPADPNVKYAIGLKGPEGATKAEVTNGTGKSEITINGASDQYYTIEPDANGNVMIKNATTVDEVTGESGALLAVTKLKISGVNDIIETTNVTADEAVSFAISFASAPIVEYVPEVEEIPAEETPAVEETTPTEEETPAEDTPAEEQTPVEEPEQGEVVIVNPTQPPVQEEQRPQEPVSNKWIGNLINSIRNLFRR